MLGGHPTWFIVLGGALNLSPGWVTPCFIGGGGTQPEYRFIGGEGPLNLVYKWGGAHSTRVWKSLTPPTNFKKTGYNQKWSKFRTVARQFFVFFCGSSPPWYFFLPFSSIIFFFSPFKSPPVGFFAIFTLYLFLFPPGKSSSRVFCHFFLKFSSFHPL